MLVFTWYYLSTGRNCSNVLHKFFMSVRGLAIIIFQIIIVLVKKRLYVNINTHKFTQNEKLLAVGVTRLILSTLTFLHKPT